MPEIENVIDEFTTTTGAQSVSLNMKTPPVWDNEGNFLIGSFFSGNGTVLNRVKLYLFRTAILGSLNALFVARVYASVLSGGNVEIVSTNVLAESTPVTGSELNTLISSTSSSSGTWVSFDFDGSFTPLKDVRYYVTFENIAQNNPGFIVGTFSVQQNASGRRLVVVSRYMVADDDFDNKTTYTNNVCMPFRILNVPPPSTVTYNDGGADSGVVPVDGGSYFVGDSVVLLYPYDLVKTGYRFLGWSRDSGALVPEFLAYQEQFWPASSTVEGDTVFYAVWALDDTKPPEPDAYKVVYNRNGATSGPVPVDSNSPYEPNSMVTVLGQGALVRANWSFLGWSTDSNATSVQYVAGNTFTIVDQDVVLYAVWQENPKYTVIYDGNGATSGSVPVDSRSPYYVGNEAFVLGQGSLQKSGYSFGGWVYNNNSSLIYQPGTSIVVSDAVVFSVVWIPDPQPPTFNVVYDGNGADSGVVPVDSNNYVVGQHVTVQSNVGNLVRNGYVFRGWAFYSAASVPAFTVTGYTVNPQTFNMGNEDVTLFAVWELLPTLVTVVYDGNGATSGTAPVDSNSPYVLGSSATVLNQGTLLRSGFLFRGWSTNPSATVPSFLPGQSVVVYVGLVLFAVWSDVDVPPEPDRYTVTYHSNGADVGVVPVDDNLYLPGVQVSVQGNTGNLAKSGCTFVGWAYTSSAAAPVFVVNGQVYPPTFNMGTFSVDLFAVWVPIPPLTFTVVYNRNGATSGATPVDSNSPYVSGSTVMVLGQGALDRANYTFKGWSVNQNVTVAEYQPNATFTITQNMVLYAVWEEHAKYTVTYDGNGNTGGSVPVDIRLLA